MNKEEIRKELTKTVKNIVLLFNEIESRKYEYERLRKELLFYMDEAELDELVFNWGALMKIVKPLGIDEKALMEKHPEIYLRGMVTKFDAQEARKHFPFTLVNRAIKECSKESTSYVKIQINNS